MFAALWAAATLFHLASYDEWGHSRLLALAAGWVLIQPGSIAALAALAVLQVYGGVALSPYISNHWLFTTFVNTAILLSATLLIARRRGARMSRVDLFEAFAPATRIGVIVLYSFAVFHKLNRDFLDPAVSCGTTFYAAQLAWWPFLPQSHAIELGSIYAALGFEAGIPLLLCWPRTRVAGIIAGAVFHWVLALSSSDRFYNFSSMLLALFSLFAPAYVVTGINPDHARFRLLTRSVLVGFLIALFVKHWAPPVAIAATDPFFALWNVYAVAITVGFVVLVWRGRHGQERPHARLFAIRPPGTSSCCRSSCFSTACRRTRGSRPKRPGRCSPICAPKAAARTTSSCQRARRSSIFSETSSR